MDITPSRPLLDVGDLLFILGCLLFLSALTWIDLRLGLAGGGGLTVFLVALKSKRWVS